MATRGTWTYAGLSATCSRNPRWWGANAWNRVDLEANPNEALTSWTPMYTLQDAYLAGSADALLGGDRASKFSLNGNLVGIATNAAQDVYGSAQFRTQAQALRPLAFPRRDAAQTGGDKQYSCDRYPG